MQNISDVIEQFILSIIGDESSVKLSRNQLANYFSVAPSQINYVLSTRFCIDRGYVIESKRGGGGGVTLVRISLDNQDLLPTLIKQIDQMDYLTANKASDIIDRLLRDKVINQGESDLLKAVVSDKALVNPLADKVLRKNILKQVLIELMRR